MSTAQPEADPGDEGNHPTHGPGPNLGAAVSPTAAGAPAPGTARACATAMTLDRHELEFSIRYASRVMERHARLYGRMDALVKLVSFLSGTAAVAGIVAQSTALAWAWGGALAVAQALAFVLRPAERAAAGRQQGQGYRQLAAQAAGLDDETLQRRYRERCAEDQVSALESLRVLAYNDVVREEGNRAEYLRPVPLTGRLLGLLM